MVSRGTWRIDKGEEAEDIMLADGYRGVGNGRLGLP